MSTYLSGVYSWLSWAETTVSGGPQVADEATRVGQSALNEAHLPAALEGVTINLMCAATPEREVQDARTILEYIAEQIDEELPDMEISPPETAMQQMEAWLSDPMRAPLLQEIEGLDLDGKGLASLPPMVLAHLPNVSVLSLRGNELAMLPSNLEELSRLTHLNLDAYLKESLQYTLCALAKKLPQLKVGFFQGDTCEVFDPHEVEQRNVLHTWDALSMLIGNGEIDIADMAQFAAWLKINASKLADLHLDVLDLSLFGVTELPRGVAQSLPNVKIIRVCTPGADIAAQSSIILRAFAISSGTSPQREKPQQPLELRNVLDEIEATLRAIDNG